MTDSTEKELVRRTRRYSIQEFFRGAATLAEAVQVLRERLLEEEARASQGRVDFKAFGSCIELVTKEYETEAEAALRLTLAARKQEREQERQRKSEAQARKLYKKLHERFGQEDQTTKAV